MTPQITLALPDRALLTVKDVAGALDCHTNTVRKLIASGQMRAVRVGRHVRVPREAVGAYLMPTSGVWR